MKGKSQLNRAQQSLKMNASYIIQELRIVSLCDGRDSKQSEHSSIMHIAQQLDSSLKMAKIQDLEAYWVILLRKLVLFQLKGPRFKNNDFQLFPFIKSDKC